MPLLGASLMVIINAPRVVNDAPREIDNTGITHDDHHNNQNIL